MADEVEIVNVGSDGVASEVTLKLLVEAVEKMAKETGKDPRSEARKVTEAHNKAVRDSIDVIEDETDARKDHTSVLRKSTRAMGGLLSSTIGIAGQAFGMVTTAAGDLASSLMDTNDSLTNFANQLPLVGSYLGLITQPIDESVDAFRSLSKVGGNFGGDLEGLRSTAVAARISLSDFTNLVQDNSQRLAAFGGNVTGGATLLSNLSNSLDEGLMDQFAAMGLTFEEINEQLLYNQYLNRAGARTRQMIEQEELEATASLTKNMLTLSKLTGQDVREAQDRLAQEQMDLAFQMERARLDEDERRKLDAAMAEALASGGETAVNALKAEFLNMPPLTRELQVYTATQTESATLIRNLLREALDTGTTYEQFQSRQMTRMADYIESQIAAGQSLESILRAGAAGADGLPAELSQMMSQNVDIFAAYMRNEGGQIRFAREQFEEDYRNGLIDLAPDDEVMARFRFEEASANFRESITNNLINPFTNLLTPSLLTLTETLNSLIGDENEEGLTGFQIALQGIGDYINNTVTPRLTRFMEAFREDPSQAIADLMSDVVDAVADFLLGPNTRMTPAGEQEVDRVGGLLSRIFGSDGFISPIIDGVLSALNEGAQAFTDFWDTDSGTEMRNTILGWWESLMSLMQDSLILGINDLTGLYSGRAEEIMSRRLLESMDREGELSDRDQRYREELIGPQLTRLNDEIERIAEHGRQNPEDLEQLIGQIRPYLSESEIQGIEDRINNAEQTHVEDQLTRGMIQEQIGSLSEQISNFSNREFEASEGFLGIGSRTAEENEEAERQRILDTINGLIGGLQQIEVDSNPQIDALIDLLDDMRSFSQGTQGFENFGEGTLAMLHGNEAVIPRASAPGELLAAINDGRINLENLASEYIREAMMNTRDGELFDLLAQERLGRVNAGRSLMGLEEQSMEQFLELTNLAAQREELRQDRMDGVTTAYIEYMQSRLAASTPPNTPLMYENNFLNSLRSQIGVNDSEQLMPRQEVESIIESIISSSGINSEALEYRDTGAGDLENFIENANAGIAIGKSVLEALERTRTFTTVDPLLDSLIEQAQAERDQRFVEKINSSIESSDIARSVLDTLNSTQEFPTDLFSTTGIENLVTTMTSLDDTIKVLDENFNGNETAAYRRNIARLVDSIDELNAELNESRSRDTNVNDVVNELNNASTPDTVKLLQELNTNIANMLSILRQSNEVSKKIEKNTASSGKDITRGKISNMR